MGQRCWMTWHAILEILKFLNYSFFDKIMTRKPKIGTWLTWLSSIHFWSQKSGICYLRAFCGHVTSWWKPSIGLLCTCLISVWPGPLAALVLVDQRDRFQLVSQDISGATLWVHGPKVCSDDLNLQLWWRVHSVYGPWVCLIAWLFGYTGLRRWCLHFLCSHIA